MIAQQYWQNQKNPGIFLVLSILSKINLFIKNPRFSDEIKMIFERVIVKNLKHMMIQNFSSVCELKRGSNVGKDSAESFGFGISLKLFLNQITTKKTAVFLAMKTIFDWVIVYIFISFTYRLHTTIVVAPRSKWQAQKMYIKPF